MQQQPEPSHVLSSIMKNVIKAVKKLKLWSKKKRKKKTHTHEREHPPPPLPCHHCCSCSSSSTTQPSAPPLPSSSWLEAEHNYGTFLLLPPEVGYPNQRQENASPVYPAPSVNSSSNSNSSYQHYMVSVSEPVYGIPVPAIQTTRRRERATGQFGCVFSFGAYLFRCLCPCFHIREVV